jgi:hypothetical protein
MPRCGAAMATVELEQGRSTWIEQAGHWVCSAGRRNLGDRARLNTGRYTLGS